MPDGSRTVPPVGNSAPAGKAAGLSLGAYPPCPEDVSTIPRQIAFDKRLFPAYNGQAEEVGKMTDREQRCCFTGHRPMKLPWGTNEDDPRCLALKLELDARLDALYSLGYRRFCCGMAVGCDMYFAEAVLKLRAAHADVRLEAAIPFGDQPGRWPLPQRQRYNRLLDQADEITVLQYGYTPDCMLRRNRYMVDRSSLLLACYDGRPGGTMSTILYAERSGVRVILIEPPE